MSENKGVGPIAWADLTVENGKSLRDFYAVGWTAEAP